MLVLQTYGYKEKVSYTAPFYCFTYFGGENMLVLQTYGYKEKVNTQPLFTVLHVLG